MSSTNERLEMALRLAGRGHYLFPIHSIRTDDGKCTCGRGDSCNAPGKHSISGLLNGRSWREISTRDETTIREWFKAKSYANIAIDCGKSNIVVLDFNSDKGKPLYENLKAKNPSSFQTVTARSGSGGYHVYYKQLPYMRAGCLTTDLVNVKGDSGYIVAPSSKHKNGEIYEFLKGLSPFDREPIELQYSLVNFIKQISNPNDTIGEVFVDVGRYFRKPTGKESGWAKIWVNNYVSKVTLGTRHKNAWLLALQLRDNSVPYDIAISAVQGYVRLVNEKTKMERGYHVYNVGEALEQYHNALRFPKRDLAVRKGKSGRRAI